MADGPWLANVRDAPAVVSSPREGERVVAQVARASCVIRLPAAQAWVKFALSEFIAGAPALAVLAPSARASAVAPHLPIRARAQRHRL